MIQKIKDSKILQNINLFLIKYKLPIIIIVGIAYIFRIIKTHNIDFHAYYSAGKILNKGSLEIYSILDKQPFVYPPTFAFVFKFFALFDFKVASVMWYMINYTALILIIIVLKKIFAISDEKSKNKYLTLTILIFLIVIQSNFDIGQINILILFFSLSAVYFSDKKNNFKASIFLSLAICIKPFLVILCIYFLIRKKFKTLAFSAINFIILIYIVPSIFIGFENAFNYNLKWLNFLSTFFYSHIKNSYKILSIYSTLLKYFSNHTLNIQGETISLSLIKLSSNVLYSLTIITFFSLIIILIYKYFKSKNNIFKNHVLISGTLLLAAFQPFISWYHYYIWLIPCVYLILLSFPHVKSKKTLKYSILISSLIINFYAKDIFGKIIRNYCFYLNLFIISIIILYFLLIYLLSSVNENTDTSTVSD